MAFQTWADPFLDSFHLRPHLRVDTAIERAITDAWRGLSPRAVTAVEKRWAGDNSRRGLEAVADSHSALIHIRHRGVFRTSGCPRRGRTFGPASRCTRLVRRRRRGRPRGRGVWGCADRCDATGTAVRR